MSAAYRLSPHTGLVHEVGPPLQVFLADLRTGPVLVLPGSAAVILLVAIELPGDEVAAEVARLTGASVGDVSGEVAGHLAQLTARGLIEPTGA